jgi:hypothetical protein
MTEEQIWLTGHNFLRKGNINRERRYLSALFPDSAKIGLEPQPCPIQHQVCRGHQLENSCYSSARWISFEAASSS